MLAAIIFDQSPFLQVLVPCFIIIIYMICLYKKRPFKIKYLKSMELDSIASSFFTVILAGMLKGTSDWSWWLWATLLILVNIRLILKLLYILIQSYKRKILYTWLNEKENLKFVKTNWFGKKLVSKSEIALFHWKQAVKYALSY